MSRPSPSLLSYLHVVTGAWQNDLRSDAELLDQFVDRGDEAAFRVLVWRHGSLVWRTCTQVLKNIADAEDAFQTVFLALARTAERLRREPLAGWLYRVARRAALDAQAKARRQHNLELRLHAKTQPKAEGEADRVELQAALDEELAKLPERLRLPLVLRYLEGKTSEEVAQIEGCSRRAVDKRLVRGETLLRERLSGRGLAVGAGAVAGLLAKAPLASALPIRLLDSTMWAAVAFRSGTLTGTVAEAALRLVPGITGWALKGSLAAALGTCVLVAAVVGGRALVAPPEAPQPVVALPSRQQEEVVQPRRDAFDDPLPKGALARLGTARFRHAGTIHTLAYAPDGKTLAAGGNNGTVLLWDSVTGKELRRLEGGGTVAFSPNGKILACAWKGQLRLWDSASGRLLWQTQIPRFLEEDQGRCIRMLLAYAPDGKTVAVGGRTKNGKRGVGVQLWDVATGKLLWQENGEAWALAFSSDSKAFTAIFVDERKGFRKVLTWTVATGEQLWQTEQLSSIFEVAYVAYMPDGKTLVTQHDGSVHLRDAASGKTLRTLKGILESTIEKIALAPDGKALVSNQAYGVLQLTDIATSKPLWQAKSMATGVRIRALAYAPDGKTLAVAIAGDSHWVTRDRNRFVLLLDAATGAVLPQPQSHEGPVAAVAYAPDGKVVFTGACDGTARRWDAASGRQLSQTKVYDSDTYTPYPIHLVHTPDGKLVAAAGLGGGFGNEPHLKARLQVWDAISGKRLWAVEMVGGGQGGGMAWLHGLAFAPDGKTLAGVVAKRPEGQRGDEEEASEIVVLWDAVSGKKLCELDLGNYRVTGFSLDDIVHEKDVRLAYAPDGKMLAVGYDGQLVLLDTTSRKEFRRISFDRRKTYSSEVGTFQWSKCKGLAFSPDGRTVVALGNGNEVGLWEVASGQKIGQLLLPENVKRHNPLIPLVLVLGPDGRTLAWGDKDGSVRVWDIAASRELCVFQGHHGPISSLAYAPDGRSLVSGSWDNTALIWDLTGLGAAPRPAGKDLDAKQLEALWGDLGADAGRADGAVWVLAASPMQAVPFLRGKMKSVAAPEPEQLRRLLANFDVDAYQDREQATLELKKLGLLAVPALRRALENPSSLEARLRIETLLEELDLLLPRLSGEELRSYRAVRVLEETGTAEARRVLEQLAEGAPGALLTREAQVALQRLARRHPVVPMEKDPGKS